MKMTNSVHNLSNFVKALPKGGVYSSKEKPPEGAEIYRTASGTEYWVRDKKTERPVIAETPTATTSYLEQYDEKFLKQYTEFKNTLNTKGTKEYKQMGDLMDYFIASNYTEGLEDGTYDSPADALEKLKEASRYKSFSQGGAMMSIDMGEEKWQPKSKRIKFSTKPTTKPVLGALESKLPEINQRGGKEHGFSANVQTNILEGLIGSRYPGNDNVNIPLSHIERTNSITLNANVAPLLSKRAEFILKKNKIPKKQWNDLRILKQLSEKGLWDGSNTSGTCRRGSFNSATEFQSPMEITHLYKKASITLYNVDTNINQQKSSSEHQTIVHELSHAVYYDAPDWVQQKALYEYNIALDNNAGFVSNYSKGYGGTGDVYEFFAECYTAYVAHTNELKERNPEMFGLMEKIFEASGGSQLAGLPSAGRSPGARGLNQTTPNPYDDEHWDKVKNTKFTHDTLNHPNLNKPLEEEILKQDNNTENSDSEEDEIMEINDPEGVIGKFNPKGKNLPPASERDESFNKSWFTNPRGSAETKQKMIKKEGDGGGFGDSGGTAFTSTDAGIFTPTHGDQPKKKKKRTGIHRLADFLTGNSPERKMSKSVDETKKLVDLIKWVTIELRKQNSVNFRQQSSGTQINDQIPRVEWKKDEGTLDELDSEPVEYDSEPDNMADVKQTDQDERIRSLDENQVKEDDEPNDTGHASTVAPAGLDVKLSIDGPPSEGIDIDALHQGGYKDLERGKFEDDEDDEVVHIVGKEEETGELYYQNIIKELRATKLQTEKE